MTKELTFTPNQYGLIDFLIKMCVCVCVCESVARRKLRFATLRRYNQNVINKIKLINQNNLKIHLRISSHENQTRTDVRHLHFIGENCEKPTQDGSKYI